MTIRRDRKPDTRAELMGLVFGGSDKGLVRRQGTQAIRSSAKETLTQMRCLIPIIILLPLAGMGCRPGTEQTGQPGVPAVSDDLATARKGFTTKLKVRGPAPQPYHKIKPPADVKEVEYTSGDLKLKGWLSVNANDGKKRPAIVFLHGGWAFDESDWKDAEAFAKAGFVLFMPRLRGENGNPGTYESFLGEVDDAIAAGRFVSALPNVDSSRVYVTGHSIGGVLTCLVSMLPSPYKAAGAFDGYVDMESWAAGSPDAHVPYDRNSPDEVRVRNPMAFTHSIRCPLRLYVGDEGREVNAPLAAKARQAGKDCELVVVQGDHDAMVAPAVQQAIEWFPAGRQPSNRAKPIATAPGAFASPSITPLHFVAHRGYADTVALDSHQITEDLRGTFRGSLHFDALTRGLYSTDASPFQITPLLVAVPEDAADVAAIVRYCFEHNLPVIPRGAGTGVAGESLGPAVVLDLSVKLRGIGEITADTVTVEPGATCAGAERGSGETRSVQARAGSSQQRDLHSGRNDRHERFRRQRLPPRLHAGSCAVAFGYLRRRNTGHILTGVRSQESGVRKTAATVPRGQRTIDGQS